MMFAFMSTGALAGTPLGGVFIKEATVEHFKKLILFSVSQSHSACHSSLPDISPCRASWDSRDRFSSSLQE
jgi:hypothetical protein